MVNLSSGLGRSPTLLLVEDNPGDARLAQEAFSEVGVAGELHVVSTGDEALDYVHQRGEYSEAPKPALIFLDWHLTGTSGEAVLTELKGDQNLKHIPVIVLTGSQPDREVINVYRNHANACITKPSDPDGLVDTVRVVEEFWLAIARLPDPAEEEPDKGSQ